MAVQRAGRSFKNRSYRSTISAPPIGIQGDVGNVVDAVLAFLNNALDLGQSDLGAIVDFQGGAGDKTQVADCEHEGVEDGLIGTDVIAAKRSRHESVFSGSEALQGKLGNRSLDVFRTQAALHGRLLNLRESMYIGRGDAAVLPMDYDLAGRTLLNNKASAGNRILLRREERTCVAASLALYGPTFSGRENMYGLGHMSCSDCTCKPSAPAFPRFPTTLLSHTPGGWCRHPIPPRPRPPISAFQPPLG